MKFTPRTRVGRVPVIVAMACSVAAASTLVGVSPSSAAITPGSDVITTAVGGGANPAITSGITSSSANLGSPLDAVFDAQGNVVFADQNNNVIRVAAASTGAFYGRAMTAGHLYTIVGNGVAGDIGDGSSQPLSTAELSGPNGVAVDAQGDIAITDSGNDAVRFVATTGGFRYGQEMTAGEIFTIAGGGQEGQITPGGSTFSAGLTAPDGVAFDALGDVIVADTGNDLVRFIPAVARTVFGMAVQPGRIYTIAGNMNFGYTGNGGPGPAAQLQLNSFNGLAVDAKGDVVFSDVGNQVVRFVAAAAGTAFGRAVAAGDIYTVAGVGTEGFKGNKGLATQAWLDTPQGVAVDAQGNLFIGDSVNNMIRFVPAGNGSYDGTAVKAGYIYTIAGKGAAAAGYSGDGGLAPSAELNSPAGVSVAPSGRLLVADNGNNVLREITGTVFGPPSVAAVKPASGPTAGDRKVTIKGVNLSDVTAVMFGTRPALTFTVKSAKKIVAYSPASSIGRVVVRVYTPVGANVVSSVDSYTYLVGGVGKKKHHHRL